MHHMQDVLTLFGATEHTIFTTDELAALTKLHPATIRRRFMDQEGVIRLGHPATRRKRQKFTLRIPALVAARVFGEMTVKG